LQPIHVVVVLGLLALVGLVIWICLQMAPYAPGADGLPAAVFGATAAGVVALLLGRWLGGRGR
jgi:hypothetical protein